MKSAGVKFFWGLALVSAAVGLLLPSPPSFAKQAGGLARLIAQYDSTGCQECHPKIYEQWSRSHHARSLMGLNNFSFMSKYLRKGPLAIKSPRDATLAGFSCAKCHLPQLMTTNDAVAQDLAEVIWRDDKATLAKLNIGCLVCHQGKAVAHSKPDSAVIYGSSNKADHEGVFKRVKESRFMSSPAFCGQCHGLGPNFEFTPPVQCATLYGSYLHAYVANGGSRTCLDCHMRGGDHTFAPDFSDRAGTARLYRAALPMEVEVLPYTFHPDRDQYQPMVVVRVEVRNLAGHRLPDG